MNAFVRAIAVLSMIGSAIGCTGTVSTPSIDHYLESARHLSEAQREALVHGRPFVGMTWREVGLAMVPDKGIVSFDARPLIGTFADRIGQRYELEFAGSPPTVIDWLRVPGDELKLKDIEELRPVFP